MKLCDYVSVSTGKSNTQDSVLDGKYPFFDRSINIKRSQKYLFDCEAIIIPGEGSSFIPRYYNGKFDLHQRCYCVYNFKNIIGKYLFYQLFYKKEYLSRVATGSTVHSLRIYNILEMPISVCDVITQQHIVNTIGSVDDLIENTEKIIEKIFKIGITKINKMNTEDVSLLKDIITIEKGTMVNPTNYLNYDNVNTIRYIRVADLLNVGKTFIDKHNKDLKISKFDDILCAFDGAPGRNNVGIFGAYSPSVYNLKCKKENKGIVYFEINCDLNQKIIKEYTHATTIAHASKSIQHLKHFNFDLETKEYFNYLFNTIVLCKIKIENLKKIKSFLLNKYF